VKTRKIKVLIVDNETEFATTLADRLHLRKMDAVCAFSGEEALIETATTAFDVVLLDIDLDDMSGLDLLTRIKTDQADPAVILLTGHGSMDTGIIGMERGAYDYLTKPVDLSLLLDKITEAHAAQKTIRR
jgi:DNA-binding response OmpR family regulator